MSKLWNWIFISEDRSSVLIVLIILAGVGLIILSNFLQS